jgi:hypothetical protein
MVVLDPRFDFISPVELVSFPRFPRAVIDAKIDMTPLREFARPARVPRAHVHCTPGRMLAVEDQAPRLHVFETYALEDVLGNFCRVEREHDAPPHIVQVEQRRRDADPIAADELSDAHRMATDNK